MIGFERCLAMHRRFFVLSAVALVAPLNLSVAETRADLTDELDLIAVEQFDKVQSLSIRENVEYCGFFGFDGSGKLTPTEPTKGSSHECESKNPPDNFEIVATYHTHGAYSSHDDSEVPSSEDLLVDFDNHVDGYVATPSGRVWLNLVEDRISVQLCGPGCVFADDAVKLCSAGAPAPEYTVDGLRRRENAATSPC